MDSYEFYQLSWPVAPLETGYSLFVKDYFFREHGIITPSEGPALYYEGHLYFYCQSFNDSLARRPSPYLGALKTLWALGKRLQTTPLPKVKDGRICRTQIRLLATVVRLMGKTHEPTPADLQLLVQEINETGRVLKAGHRSTREFEALLGELKAANDALVSILSESSIADAETSMT